MLHSVLGRFYFITVKAPLKELYQHILGMARITLCEENLTSHVCKIKSHSVAKRHKGSFTRPAKPCVAAVRCVKIRNNPNFRRTALRRFIDYLG